jgi:hypothetical protein
VFDTATRPDVLDIDTMKVKGSGKKLSNAQTTISNLLDETQSYDIFTASSRKQARENIMGYLRTNRPDKTSRDAILSQVRINSLFNVVINTDIRMLDENSQNHLNQLITNGGLRDAVTAFDVSKKYDEELNIKIQELEHLKMLNQTRGEFLNELISKKQYKVHSKFIGECVQEYEVDIITNNDNNAIQCRRDEDEFINDLLNNRVETMSLSQGE